MQGNPAQAPRLDIDGDRRRWPRAPTSHRSSRWRSAIQAVAAAARSASARLDDHPIATTWRRHGDALLRVLGGATARADAEVRASLEAHLHHVATRSYDDEDLLRRLVLLARHAQGYVTQCGDARLPPRARAHATERGLALFDRLARVRRDPELEQLARRRNDAAIALGLRPRSLALLDWCDLAVRIAQGAVFEMALRTVDPTTAVELRGAKVRFDLLAIELNIALDDLADDGRDPGLFTLAVERMLGPSFARELLPAHTELGRDFWAAHAQAELHVTRDASGPAARYVALVAELYARTTEAGRELALGRWDEAVWRWAMRRIVESMMLAIVQNAPEPRPAMPCRAEPSGEERLRAQAANSNRMVFELVGLWCAERITGVALEPAVRRRLLAAFEELEVAQQLCNCLATLDREIEEGDRSNCVVSHAEQVWRATPREARGGLVDVDALVAACGPGAVDRDDVLDALYRVLADPEAITRADAARCVHQLVARTDAEGTMLRSWGRRIEVAAETLDELGFDGAASRRAQIDLLLLHLILLRRGALEGRDERR